ncbi:hypothetical protein V8E53_014121 [Lactarius tabidus]
MSDYFLPNYSQIAGAVSEVADNLDRTRDAGLLRRNLPSAQIERGDALMNGSRVLYSHCFELMDEVDQENFRTSYNEAIDAREKLDARDLSGIQRFREARNIKRLSKKSYQAAKRGSDRALDNGLLGRNGGAAPAGTAGLSPATPEESGETDPPGPPPVTPKEPPRPPPHNLFTESHAATTCSMGERIQDTQITTLPLGNADTERPTDGTRGASTFIYEPSKATSEITLASYKTAREILDTTTTTLSSVDAGMGGPIDEVPETNSFIYDENLATSGTSITFYKTENISVISVKSRYNVLPRHKYAHHGYSRLQGPGSLGLNDAPVPKTELGDEYDQSRTSPPSGTRPLDGPSTASPNTEAHDVPEETQSRPPSPHQLKGRVTQSEPIWVDGWSTGKRVV